MKHEFSSGLLVAALAAGLVALTAGGIGAARSDKWWWDNLGGPDSSSFAKLDQIKKTNVAQLDVAWTYPYASSGFNPIVVDDVVYTAGRNGSLVALDAATGKEIWIHEDLSGTDEPRRELLAERGRKRPAPSLSDQQASFRRSTRKTGQSDADIRPGRRREPARRPRRAGEDIGLVIQQSRQGLAQPVDSRIDDGRGVHLTAWRHSRVRRRDREARLAVPHGSAARASSATRRGRQMPTSTSAARTTGDRSPSTTSAASSTCRPDRRPTISTAPTGMARISSRTACLRSTPGQANASGISRRSITICGTSTTSRRPCSSPSVTTDVASTPSRTRARPDSSTSSIA